MRVQNLTGACELPLAAGCGFGRAEREFAATATDRREIIQQNSTPLDLVDWQQKAAPCSKRLRVDQSQRASDGCDHLIEKRGSDRYVRLAEKITDELRRVVPARVFEIEKHERMVFPYKCIVKPKIRR